jgi:hypothetical protein
MNPERWFFPLLFIIALGFSAFFHRGDAIKGVIWADAEGYYIYLPALLVHDGFEDVPFVNGCTLVTGPDGVERTFTKYTCGVALMQSPFVFAGHVLAPMLGHPRDGRSAPYAWGILIAAAFYMSTGLYLLSKWLSAWFTPRTIYAVLILIFLATNLFYYTVREAGMSHVYSFFLFSVFLISAQRFRSGEKKWLAAMASSLALIILIRPTNGIIAFAPLLMGNSVRNEIRFWWSKRVQLLLFIPILLLVFAPQLVYWKHTTGNLLWYSYGDEGFSNWLAPKMFSVLFSPQNGLFLYTPLMFLIVWGMWLHWHHHSAGRWMNPITLLVATYIFGSWWAWWFGGAFGHRCYVEYFALMTLPLGFALQRMLASQLFLRYAAFIILAVLVVLNIHLSHIYGGMWDGPDWSFVDYADKVLRASFIR